MSYRHDQTRKGKRAKTGKQLAAIVMRDTRFCERWGIPQDQAWRWARWPDGPVPDPQGARNPVLKSPLLPLKPALTCMW